MRVLLDRECAFVEIQGDCVLGFGVVVYVGEVIVDWMVGEVLVWVACLYKARGVLRGVAGGRVIE